MIQKYINWSFYVQKHTDQYQLKVRSMSERLRVRVGTMSRDEEVMVVQVEEKLSGRYYITLIFFHWRFKSHYHFLSSQNLIF